MRRDSASVRRPGLASPTPADRRDPEITEIALRRGLIKTQGENAHRDDERRPLRGAVGVAVPASHAGTGAWHARGSVLWSYVKRTR
jgi:hypothetical protein